MKAQSNKVSQRIYGYESTLCESKISEAKLSISVKLYNAIRNRCTLYSEILSSDIFIIFLLRLIILFSRFVLTNQNQLIMEDFNHQGIWEYAVKRIADPKLKAEDCKSSAAAANF